jgi:DNA/RNA-binding domain of Phe-tRNA-synthetase-like protein
MPEISISAELKSRCPKLRLGCILAEVIIAESGSGLLLEITERIELIQQSLIIEGISKIPAIEASRKAYKACGKDPARYRLSAEALMRRVVSGKGLYQINNVVDQLNLISITAGFSIGGYDADQIQGTICFGIGNADESYSGIGRGGLNIENLPVFRDELGAFGTPTSDSQRTEVTDKTSRFLMILIDFGGDGQLENAKQMAIRLLKEYCQATNINEFNTTRNL